MRHIQGFVGLSVVTGGGIRVRNDLVPSEFVGNAVPRWLSIFHFFFFNPFAPQACFTPTEEKQIVAMDRIKLAGVVLSVATTFCNYSTCTYFYVI